MQAAMIIKVWMCDSEKAAASEFSGLTVGFLLKCELTEDEQQVVAELLSVMWFSSSVYRLFDEEVNDGGGMPYELADAVLKLEKQAVEEELSEQIEGQPEQVLNNFDTIIEACQVVVAVTEHTPGTYGAHTQDYRCSCPLKSKAWNRMVSSK